MGWRREIAAGETGQVRFGTVRPTLVRSGAKTVAERLRPERSGSL